MWSVRPTLTLCSVTLTGRLSLRHALVDALQKRPSLQFWGGVVDLLV
ncbi:MAG: hypothetical protein P8Q92_13200 [Pseudoprimorskyibacter sp.]|jgi:hypothetical protein|nr:hypothetical protein [Pseudoprimorskyibacter sp.]